MTDSAAAFQPGADDVTVQPAEDAVTVQPAADEVTVSFRPRGAYTGYRAFGSGAGAVLLAPSLAHDLRSAAEFATAERRIAGGLLYGRGWADEVGTYLVIDHYLEAGPGENSGDRISGDGDDDFTLSEAGLRLLREDAARMFSASLEVGWWRTRAGLGEFGPEDFVTQGELVGPDGVGLLVYGSGIYWGTAYLGPVGLAPDSAGTLSAVPDPVTGPPGPGQAPAQEAGIAPEPEVVDIAPEPLEPEVVDIAAGESLEQEPSPPGTAPPRRRVRRRRAVSVRGTVRRRGARLADEDGPGPAAELPADVQFVVGALMAVTVAAAIIIGLIVSSLLVGVIIGAVGLLVIVSSVWMSRRY
jgi:hypothetical protein